MNNKPNIEAFFDEPTNSVTYIIWDTVSREAAVIDSVLDYDLISGRTKTESVEKIAYFIEKRSLSLKWIMETHVHADHVSAAQWLKKRFNAPIVISKNICKIQEVFNNIFDVEPEFRADGSQFDILADENQVFALGDIEGGIIHTPGHTPACMSILFGDALFVGDLMFMPDYGTARCDFPGGDARLLYQSIQKILSLPAETRFFTGHDYKAKGRDYFAWESTIGIQKTQNLHIASCDEEAFVKLREARDQTLSLPRMIIPSVQINMRAGQFPPAAENGHIYLKVPINLL